MKQRERVIVGVMAGVISMITAGLVGSLYAQTGSQSPQKEEIVLTTYYPVPYGDYQNLRLWPIPQAKKPCDENGRGTLYFDDSRQQVMVCRMVSPGQYEWQQVGGPPIGTIEAWHKSLQGTPGLPDGWVECNGQTINDPASLYNGQEVPNLNSAPEGHPEYQGGSFLRGGSISGVYQDDATARNGLGRDRQQVPAAPGDGNNWNGWIQCCGGWELIEDLREWLGEGDSETRPVNMTVVWIIRIK